MKNLICSFVLIFVVAGSTAQTAFWTEDFGTGCSQGQVANGFNPSVNGVWTTTTTGTFGSFPNEWFISAAEAGMGVGNCGDGCLGTGPNNRTLHVGYNFFSPFIDQGASYLPGPNSNTDERAESPLINCTGRSNIVLGFNYFLGGIAASDYLEVVYSANGGVTWSSVSTPSMTPTGSCSPQGLWTGYTVALPASANNNANVKVGFRWQNNDPSGATLSVAIDDVQLSAPAAAFTASFALTNSVCPGSSVTVTANTGTTVATGYTWTASPAGPVIAAANASVTGITFPAAGTFTIGLTAASGTSTASYSNTITVNPSPTITIYGTGGPLCPPPTAYPNLTLTATGALSYTWTPGPLAGTTININPATTTTYTVIGTGTNGCTGTTTHSVSVYPLPSISAGSSSPVCASSTLCLNSSAGLILYSWSGPCTYTSSNQNDCFIVASGCGGTYTIEGTDANGCVNQATTAVTVSPCTGIEQLSADNNGYSVYPNPASDKLFVTRYTASSLDVAIEVMDVLGKIVLKQSQSYTAAENTRIITVAGLPAGVYFVKLAAAGEQPKLIRILKEQ